jgi:hypothetical protein
MFCPPRDSPSGLDTLRRQSNTALERKLHSTFEFSQRLDVGYGPARSSATVYTRTQLLSRAPQHQRYEQPTSRAC